MSLCAVSVSVREQELHYKSAYVCVNGTVWASPAACQTQCFGSGCHHMLQPGARVLDPAGMAWLRWGIHLHHSSYWCKLTSLENFNQNTGKKTFKWNILGVQKWSLDGVVRCRICAARRCAMQSSWSAKLRGTSWVRTTAPSSCRYCPWVLVREMGFHFTRSKCQYRFLLLGNIAFLMEFLCCDAWWCFFIPDPFAIFSALSDSAYYPLII